MALLLLLILTLLGAAIMRTTILESKMSNHFVDKVISICTANRQLISAEHALRNGRNLYVKNTSVTIISTAICGVTIYRLTTQAYYHGATTRLQSTYAVVNSSAHCASPPMVTPGRQSWRDL